MNNINSSAIIYYSGAFVLSVLVSAALIIQLPWPASAEIPLCLSIFIQFTAMAKKVLNIIQETDTESILETYAMVKAGAVDSEAGN